MQHYRTDLAREARDLAGGRQSGVEQAREQRDGMTIERIEITTDAAARRLDKPKGRYVTIDTDEIPAHDPALFAAVTEQIAGELQTLLGALPTEADVLVVGLGNRFVTPDALGPETVDRIYVTRHFRTDAPELAPAGLRAVSAMAPGVLGTTGIETGEIVRGLVSCARPAAVICVDALAARSTGRINRTVQLSDGGISPGSGIGNRRDALSRETLGVPVVAVGVPMVVYASTIAADAVGLIAARASLPDGEEALRQLADEVVREHFGPLIVTPKEIDALIGDTAEMLADGINRMLQRECFAELKALFG